MTNWEDIHQDFTPELQKEWENFGFDCEEVQRWIDNWSLQPNDADFALYLGERGYTADEVEEEDELEELRNDYNKITKKKVYIKGLLPERKTEKVIDPNDKGWENVKPDFAPELIHEWQKYGFSYQEYKEWIDIGLKTTDAAFCAWLRDIKQVDSEWVLNCGVLEKLTSEYQQFSAMIQQITNK